jgi:hypothetical protein
VSGMQTIEIRFRGEELGTYTDGVGCTWMLYRTCYPNEGYYRIHGDDGDQAWVESGRYGSGLEDWEVLQDWPEFTAAILAS